MLVIRTCYSVRITGFLPKLNQNLLLRKKYYDNINNKNNINMILENELKNGPHLTHSAPEKFEKMALKKAKKKNFRRFYLEN